MRQAAEHFALRVKEIVKVKEQEQVKEDIETLTAQAAKSLFERVACCKRETEDGTKDVGDVVDISVAMPGGGGGVDVILPATLRTDCLEGLISGCYTDVDTEEVEVVCELGGAVGTLLECAVSCNHDVRASVLRNVVVCGGGAMLPGLPESICHRATVRSLEEERYAKNVRRPVLGLPGQCITASASASDTTDPNILGTGTGNGAGAFAASSLAWVGGGLFALQKEDPREVTASSLPYYLQVADDVTSGAGVAGWFD